MGITLPYDDLHEIRKRMNEISPNLTRYGDAEDANYFAQATELGNLINKPADSSPFNVPMKQLEDFYMTGG